MSTIPTLKITDLSNNVIMHAMPMAPRPRPSYAAMIAAPKAPSTPKITVPVTIKLDKASFAEWLFNDLNTKSTSSGFRFPLKKPLRPLVCHERIKIWHEDPIAAIMTHPTYSVGYLDYQDHMLFIHAFPEIFDLMIHSRFACSILGPRTESSDDNALHTVMYAQVFRPTHTYRNLSIPSSIHQGPLVYTINPLDKVCFHKCYEPETSYVTDNPEFYGWSSINNYLKTKKFPLVNTIDFSKFPEYNPGNSEIQIFWTSVENVLTFITPDQTVYRFFPLI
jgi:hypothetical protein